MLLLFSSLLLLFLLNVPLSFAVGISCMIYLVFGGLDVPLVLLTHRFLRGLDSFPLMAIPFFMLAGQFMGRGSCAKRLIDFAESFVGWMKGGLAHINIMSSMFFAGMTGSAVSDTSAIGSILIPSMIRSGYSPDVTAAITATSSVIGIIIPPSVIIVIYGVVAEQSIGALLLAGIIPGILLGFALMIAVAIYAHVTGYQAVTNFSMPRVIHTFKRAFLSLITVIIVVGGIYGGIFTATEASIMAAVYSFLLVKFVYREITWRQVADVFIETSKLASLGLFLYGLSNVFTWIIATEQVPEKIFNLLIGITSNRTLIIIFIIILLLALGTVLESVAAILIFVPILGPIGQMIGLDPIHFGMIVCLAIGLGLATPPVGVCLFIACGLANVEVSRVAKAIIPYFIASLIVLLLVAFIPDLSLFIPKKLM
jgi:tripartite ATP-independent transporter DctM subunit